MTTHNLFEAFFLKLQLNLKAEARSSYLNYAWWVLEPALNVALFYFVFEVLLGPWRGGFRRVPSVRANTVFVVRTQRE